MRELQIPTIRDRVVQGAVKLILEAISEADFCANSNGLRPKRSPQRALVEVRRSLLRRMTRVIDVDLTKYFGMIRHSVLQAKIASRVQDTEVMHLVKQKIQAAGKVGVPQGGLCKALHNITTTHLRASQAMKHPCSNHEDCC